MNEELEAAKKKMRDACVEYLRAAFKATGSVEIGAYIQLIFLGNLRIPFCTIRSAYPPSKVAYYYNGVGRTFAIEVKNPDDAKTCALYQRRAAR